MNLDQWMRANDLRDGDVAARVGSTRTTISRVRRGVQRGKWELLRRLVTLSGGAVSLDEASAERPAPPPVPRGTRRRVGAEGVV